MVTLTKYGIREWGTTLVIALLLIAFFIYLAVNYCPIAGYLLAALTLLLWLGIAAFFRSPARTIVADETLIVSPADGTVKDIETLDFSQKPFPGKAKRVGIFLSVFNVHVNRAPADWTVESKEYREGRYLDARDEGCIKENEAMTVAGTAVAAGRSFPLAVRQISGAIARRIVCPVSVGDQFRKGDIYGMIKFGSRTELYLPDSADFEILVKIGDKVKAGETVIARIVK